MAVKVSGTTVIDGSRNVVNVGTVDGRDVSVDGAKLDSIESNAQVNVPTNLGQGGTGNSRTITSSTGTDVTVSTATGSNAGFMSTNDKTKLDGVEAGAQVNVPTNLGSSGTGATRTITSSTGSDTSITYSAADLSAVPTSRNIGTSGIATGGGNLTADRTINVPGTNLGSSGTGGTRTITSSTGNNTSITYSAADLGAVPTSRVLTAGTGIAGGGDLSANRTFSIDNTVVTLTGSQTLTNKNIIKNVQVISTNTTAAAFIVYVIVSNLTLTLPASPTVGTQIHFSNRSDTTTPVIARNGQNIMGIAENLILDNVNAFGTLVYADATRGWIFQ
jgi:hypothetical protein